MTSVSCGSWNRTNGLLVQGQASLPVATVPHLSYPRHARAATRFALNCGRRNRTYELLRPTLRVGARVRHHYQQRLPRSAESVLRESNPPRPTNLRSVLGRLEPLPLGQGHVRAEGEGVEPIKALVALDRFRSGCRRQSACPSVHEAAAAGIEPASGRLTVAFPYQHRTHRISQDGWFRTSDLVLPRPPAPRRCPAGCQTSLHPEFESAQRESNPRFRHGKAVGWPLHHGRLVGCRVVKDQQSTGPDSNRRRRCTGAGHRLARCQLVASPLDDQCFSSGTGGDRTHIVRFKRPVHYQLCHSPESVGAEGVEPSTCVL
jgi:hypothetical protein